MNGHDALTLPPESLRQDTLRPEALCPDTETPGEREIGSDFELVEDRYLDPVTSTPLPWEDSADITYVESGRQALALVAAELHCQGHTQLHVPSYLCDSMIRPFHSAGWTLTCHAVDNDLALRPQDLVAQVTAGVFLHTPYFGRQDSPAMLEALQTLRRRGVVVVVDETHRLFSGPSPVADARVASLRKMLPVHDGGYVAGLSGSLQASLGAPTSRPRIAELRGLASLAKSKALSSGADNGAHLALFAEAEHATEVQARPVPISSSSLASLHRLNLDLIRTTRQANSTLLALALGRSERFRIINPPAADLMPSHLVLELQNNRSTASLQRYLAGRRIYCPVHWPPSALLPRARAWPSRYISLPVDHRYGPPDMWRIAFCIKTFLAKDVSAEDVPS